MRILAAFRKKLDSKSKERIFVGYSDNTKRYRLVDSVTKKLQIARDVVFFETQFMSSDNASPFDLNDKFQERTTIPIIVKNLVEINDGQWEILQTPVEVGTSLSQDSERTLEVGTSLSQDSERTLEAETSLSHDSEGTLDVETSSSQDVEGRPRRNCVPNSNIFNKEFVVYQAAQCECSDPTTVWEALNSPYSDDWIHAMNDEIEVHVENRTWTLSNLPPGKKAIKSKWVFKTKLNSDGILNVAKLD